MKLRVIGVKRVKGDKSKAGNPFDMPRLFAMVPIETACNEKVVITGKGYEIVEIPFDPESEAEFLKLNIPQEGIDLDLKMDSRPRMGKFESICVGYEVIQKQKAN
jgi:hypothetical protein